MGQIIRSYGKDFWTGINDIEDEDEWVMDDGPGRPCKSPTSPPVDV